MALCESTNSSIRVEGVKVIWARQYRFCAQTVADSAGSLNDTYFVWDDGTTSYYVWYNVAAAGTDPALGGTGIEVALSSNASAIAVAQATQAAIDANSELYAAVNGDVVCITNKAYAAVTADVADTGATGFTFEVCVSGLFHDFGLTQDGFTVELEQLQTEVVADQFGANPADILKTGTNATGTTSLLEMTVERWSIVTKEALGGGYTPSAGNEIVGFGSGQSGLSFYNKSGVLALHPVTLPDSDRSRDLFIPKTLPQPTSFNFSGSDPSVLGVTFASLVDRDINSAINVFGVGDWQQDLRQ